MIGNVSASSNIILSLDKPHVVLQGGYSENITLTIENNGSSIESYNITLDINGLSSVWNITSVNSSVDSILPTFSKQTDIVIRLDVGAAPSDSGSFIINVSQQDSDIYAHITAYVSVEPSYASSLSFNSINGPLQKMHAGASANFTIDVNNDGNVPDTILLNVDSEPDLAAFWANHNNNTNNNNSNNNTNNTGNNTNTTVNVPANVLMYGNSYTYSDNIDEILFDMFDSVGEPNSTAANTSGGLSFVNHWNNINSSGNTWNTSLRNVSHAWDFVVLQDQSQIPGLLRSDQNWIDSMNAGVSIVEAIENESSEAMLFMTWGRRSGDQTNAALYSNFTNMQDRLEDGYIDYRDNMSTPTRDVWIAPVGLGFKNIYYDVINSGGNPNVPVPANTFYELYDADGSHPSLSGSYLAACILYSSMTGAPSVNLNDSVVLSNGLKLELQQAADDTVFNQTSHLDYPWQSTSNPSLLRQTKAIPPGWNLVFADEEISNIAAYSTVQTTVEVSVPSNAQPGFYGFNLFSATTGGNNSSSYTFVVEVLPENNLSFSFLDQDSNFIPGQSVATSVQVTNTGNAELNLNWQLSSSIYPCNVSLVDASSSGLMPGDVVNVGFLVDIDSSSDMSDSCDISLDGIGMYGDYQYDPEAFNFTINIDEYIEFDLVPASDAIFDITPGVAKQYQLRLYNNGSEDVEFLLDVMADNPLLTDISSASLLNVSSRSVGIWDISTNISNGFIGLYLQNFSVTYQSLTSQAMVSFDVQPVADFSISGPLDGRISTKPGDSVNVDLELSNAGTMDLNLSASVLGLPTGSEVTFSSVDVDLDAGQMTTVVMNVSMISTADSGTYPISVTFSSDEISQSINLELQVADSVGLTVNSISNNIAAGPISEVSYTFEVTNLGSASDTFFVALSYDDSNNASSWFDTILSTSSINLDSSSTQAVTISIRERVAGAPSSGCDVTILVTSSNDESISSSIGFKIIPIQVSAQLTILADDNSAKPGDIISGDVVVTNTGTGEDQFLLTTVGNNCDLSEIFTLSAGSSSQAYNWSCPIDTSANAGLSSFTFRVTSNARSNYVLEEMEIFTVEPNWGDDGIVSLEFGDSSLIMASSGGSSTSVTVTNLANAPITGDLFILGSDESLFDLILMPMDSAEESNKFSLSNGQTMVFELLLNSRVSQSESASLRLSATIEVDSVTYTQESDNMSVGIEGPELPPNGIELPFDVKLDQSQALSIMAGGWAFAILLILLMNMLRKRRKKASNNAEFNDEDDADEPTSKKSKKSKKKEEEDVKVHKLQPNECRMTPDNKVICPFCEAKLGVPRGSTPPFKFTCPKCDEKIRVVENQKF